MDAKLEERYKLLGITDPFEHKPSLFDCGTSLAKLVILFGRLSKGMGSLFFLVYLDLNETQSGIPAIVSKVAQEKDWPLILI